MGRLKSSEAKRILVVDDHDDTRDIFSHALKKEGYKVILAIDGVEGFEKVEQEKPDLVVLDVMLPKMNGIELCRIMKAHPSYRFIPIFLITAKVEPAFWKQIEEACPATAILTKPVYPADLLKTITDYFKKPTTPLEP